MKERENFLIFAGLLFLVLLLGFVLAIAPTWQGSDVNYTLNEDTNYYHDLRENITGYNNDVSFAIDTESNITWTNSSGIYNVSKDDVSNWISILDSITGNFSINATFDNQTGFFIIPIQATNTTDEEFTGTNFEFIINATNDAPEFLNLNNTYNLTQEQGFLEYINATDEEEHFPLFFNISFFNNCSLADWSERGAGNCSIFNLTSASDNSSLMNFTPVRNDVGVYWANVSVMDNGNNSLCPHGYCDNDTYQQNKTSYEIIKFNVFSILEINVTDCQDKIFQENVTGTCQINITTNGENDSLNISSYAFLRNYDGSVSNTSWFYAENSTNATNFIKTITINITPDKTEVGNWTINFTVLDLSFDENATEQIYVYVNRTYNDAPELVNIADKDTSINLVTRINLTVYDDDLLIPDKNESYGGYNETITFDITILNQTNLSEELSLNGFDVEILNMPVSGTNTTEAKIEFTPNSTEAGNYTINITASDEESSVDYKTFNLTIIDNEAPVWNESLQTEFSVWEDNETYLNLSQNITDPDGDSLTFSFTNDTEFPSFSLNSTTGIINFTSLDADVGQHLVNITVSDGYLTNSSVFSFTVYNINDTPVIGTPLLVDNASVDANSNVNATEDNYTKLTLYVYDDDFKIPSGQKSFYNESLTINLTIEGNNENLFNFTITDTSPIGNLSIYEAIFTPNKTDVGDYNVTINATDLNSESDTLSFNLTITEINHNPVLTALTNQTSAVNRTVYYDINASDIEDGNESTGNLTFSYDFLNGTDFINNNETIFNFTTGVLNITFNSTQGGSYNINITVNDSTGLEDYETFWIYVYDLPNITFPVSSENFSLQENVTSNLTFRANHSVADNLTYLFYIDNIVYSNSTDFNYTSLILRENQSYYGNDTNLTWSFMPNFSDETYGNFKNLSLIVYPSNTELENRTELNKTINWNINITHTNSPVEFSDNIGDKQADYNTEITIDLTQYFSDVDYSDNYYNQDVDFTINSNSSSSSISSSVSNWVLTLSSSIAVSELLNITGNDSSSNDTSNNFIVQFTTPTTTPVPTPSGGGSRKVPVSLKIIMPGPLSVYEEDRIEVPITLHNTGSRALFGIDLTSVVAKDGIIRDDITVSFDKSSFSSLDIGEKKNLTMTVYINTEEAGTFEITVNATVQTPDYHDWGKLYITVEEEEDLWEMLLFTEEFIAENPECIELKEIVNEAKKYFNEGKFDLARQKAEEAIDACKIAISQPRSLKAKKEVGEKIFEFLVIAMLFDFMIGFSYYFYKRVKLKRKYLLKKEELS